MNNIFHKIDIAKKNNKYKNQLSIVKFNIIKNKTLSEEDIIKAIKLEKELLIKIALIVLLVNNTYNINVYDEQILAVLALYDFNVLDMKTGEGKTIVALITSILHSLNKNTVHLITANDYLVSRDFNFGKAIYEKLEIKTSLILDEMKFSQKADIYSSSIIYTTAKNICFDYLNNSLVKNKEKQIIKNLDIAIIDEIDFVLIEEARSPISISGKEDSEGIEYLIKFNEIIKDFTKDIDFKIDDKSKNIEFTEIGFKKFEDILINMGYIKNNKDLYTNENTKYIQLFNQTIKANFILKRDVDYVVLNNDIVIVDENTGRLVLGKTWNGGLHQAVEIKENLEIHKDSKTLATTSLQGFFSKYKHICGMSGTSKDDEIEFREIYNLDVIEIPTHKKLVRKVYEDILFSEKKYALDYLVDDIKKNHDLGRPILIGTTTVKDSEIIYQALLEKGLNSEILNAKNHEKESLIIESAGKYKKITIATNMAGRGTDIMLGGNKETEIKYLMNDKKIDYETAYNVWLEENKKINKLGGLYVIGFSRSTSKKLDNQLMGRCARQGDNGSCRFYLTLEDELLSVFGKAAKMLWSTLTMGVKNVGISDKKITKQIMEAQKKSENFLFNFRKSMLRYSQINEKQFDIINTMRNNVLAKDNKIDKEFFNYISKEVFSYILEDYEDNKIIDENRIELKKLIKEYTGISENVFKDLNKIEDIENLFYKTVINLYEEKIQFFIDKKSFEKEIILRIIDDYWTEHLTALENIKKGTSFRSVAQKNPFEEFKNESFKLFDFLIKQIFIDIIKETINLNPVDFIREINDNTNNFSNVKVNLVNYMFLDKINKFGF